MAEPAAEEAGRGPENGQERGAELDPGLLNDLAGHLMRHAFLRAQQVFAEVFEGEGLTSLQFMVLELVDRNPGVGHREVAGAMSSAPSVLTSVMRPLVEGGLVLREAASGDGRKVSYRLSQAGRRRFSDLRPRIAQAETRLLAGLDPVSAERFRDTLRHIAGRPRAAEIE